MTSNTSESNKKIPFSETHSKKRLSQLFRRNQERYATLFVALYGREQNVTCRCMIVFEALKETVLCDTGYSEKLDCGCGGACSWRRSNLLVGTPYKLRRRRCRRAVVLLLLAARSALVLIVALEAALIALVLERTAVFVVVVITFFDTIGERHRNARDQPLHTLSALVSRIEVQDQVTQKARNRRLASVMVV
jgi:hypothetical protein